jgi:hypothetical protein
MNEQTDFERLVADQISNAGVGAPPPSAIDDTITRAGGSRRLPAWLALIKEPPMRTNNHLAVGSPTVRVVAVLAATLLLALALAAAGAGAQQLLAADGPIIVAQDGSGDYTTITEAVSAAEDGDEILVKPGTYAEVVHIDKDITVRGDGQREEVILEFDSTGPRIDAFGALVPYGLMLVDTEATVSDITVHGPNVAVAFVFVGGAPTLERVANDLEGEWSGRAHASVAVLHGAGGTLRESRLDGPVFDAGASQVPEHGDVTGTGRFIAEDNVLDAGFGLDVTDGSAFLRNRITPDGVIELLLAGGGSVLIAENETPTIELLEQSDGFVIRDNIVSSSPDYVAGINLAPGAPTVEGNVVTGATIGVLVPEGATPTITGNELEGMRVGISVIGDETVAVIEGNRFCDNEQDLRVPEGSSLTLDASNEVCEGATE